MFGKRRAATPQELARLTESFDVTPAPVDLSEAEIGEIASIDGPTSCHVRGSKSALVVS